MEVSSSVANGRQSVVAEQTENRLYAIQAVLALCLKR
jgi:ornithine carbamoyltransferase